MIFVVYCVIFQHICILFTVISMFYIDFWGFTNDPLYLGYNSAEQENPVLCIFNFQGPSRTQKDLEFSRIVFSSRQGPGALGLEEGTHQAQDSTCGAAQEGDRATQAISAVELPIASFFVPPPSF